MEPSEAIALIRDGVAAPGGVWADLGAGAGTFTLALATLLGRDGVVHAVDLRPGVQAAEATAERARIVTRQADFTQPLALPELDGIVMANALHFVRDQASLLGTLASHLKQGAAFILVEYDQRRGGRWVPHPVPPDRFAAMAPAAGLSRPREIGRIRSRYGPQDIYAAVAQLS